MRTLLTSLHLPSGRTLAPTEWRRRHRCAVAVLWLHVLVLGGLGIAMHPADPLEGLAHGAFLVPFALLACRRSLNPRLRQTAVTLGLLTSSAIVVHVAGGAIEAHFHYFLVVALLSIYEDWMLFFASLLYVLLEHAAMGMLEPRMVFADGGSVAGRSAVHAAAITFLGVVNVLNWRFSEDVRLAATKDRGLLAYSAVHDDLTGLPNRRLLAHEMGREAARCGDAEGSHAAALFVDLDNFKLINDSFGHPAGDQLLIDVAGRLRASVRDTDFVARSGGDEFVVIARPVADDDASAAVAARLMESFEEPFEIVGAPRRIGASIGVSRFGADGVSAVEGLARADAAMYRAKADGRGRLQVADGAVLDSAARRMAIADALQDVEAADVEVHYQPVVDLTDGSIHAVEALIRWTHPDLGPISPGEFIPVAEGSGRILDLGRWVLDRACRDALRWETLRGRPLPVFVNVSASQISHPSFARTVIDAFASTGATARNIALEMTETAALDLSSSGDTVASLRDARVDLILDDFGVGYSSLEYLTRFPISLIKLDRSFLAEPSSPQHRAILGAVVELGRGLMTPTLAEGIETVEQLAIARGADFRFGQGYLFARPQPTSALDELVMADRPYRDLMSSVASQCMAA